MAEQKQESARIDWRQSVSWLSLFRCFRLALDVKKMFLGFLALVLTAVIFFLMREVWSGIFGVESPPRNALRTVASGMVATVSEVPRAVWRGDAGRLALEADNLLRYVGNRAAEFPVFCVVYGVLLLLVWSYFGGAICRLAAVQFGRDERISLTEALSFTCRKYVSLVFAPLIPVLAIVFVCIFTGLVGLLVAIPGFGPWFAAVLWPLPMIVGFILALIVIGGIFGLPLMHPTIGAEGSDAFDAISRSFSYVYSRPWRAGFYAVLAIAYGLVVFTFVVLFAGLLLYMSGFCVSFVSSIVGLGVAGRLEGMWPGDITYMNWDITGPGTTAAGHVLRFWVWLVYGLVLGFGISYAYSALTAIYFLLRKNVDHTEFDEIYLEEEEEETFDEVGEGETAKTVGEGEEAAAPKTEEAGEGQKPAPEHPEEGGEEKDEPVQGA